MRLFTQNIFLWRMSSRRNDVIATKNRKTFPEKCKFKWNIHVNPVPALLFIVLFTKCRQSPCQCSVWNRLLDFIKSPFMIKINMNIILQKISSLYKKKKKKKILCWRRKLLICSPYYGTIILSQQTCSLEFCKTISISKSNTS